MNLITSHLTRLFDFSGRENRKPFWLWILCVWVAQTVVQFIAYIPLSFRIANATRPLSAYDQSYLDAHPEVAINLAFGVMGPLFRDLMIMLAVLTILQLVLIAAAVVRRLHDGNRSGWWAAPSLVIQLVTLASYAVMFPKLFAAFSVIRTGGSEAQINTQMSAAMSDLMPWFMGIGLLGFIGFGLGVMLLIFFCTRGTVGPNRYGADLVPPPSPYPYPPQPWQGQPGQQPWQGQQQWQGQGAAPMPPARVVRPWDNPPPGPPPR